MLENITLVQFMLAVMFIVFTSISFGMQLRHPEDKQHIIHWVRKTITRLLLGDEEDR